MANGKWQMANSKYKCNLVAFSKITIFNIIINYFTLVPNKAFESWQIFTAQQTIISRK
jgi:hypothetical protein